jgi:hypothetical protein
MNNLCIGLFGTCGDSRWRDRFIKQYSEYNINYFNPQIDNWNPEFAIEEAEHLANDSVIVFPVTSETYGTGSLAEVGFSILNAIKLDDRRFFIIMIDQFLNEELMENTIAAKESLRSRALVLQHLKRLNLSNVYLVNDLSEALNISITCYNVCTELQKYQQYSLRNINK